MIDTTGMGGGYVNNFNNSLNQNFQNMEVQNQLGELERQISQLQQQEAMSGMQNDQFGGMNFPPMGGMMPMGGMVPMGGINPMSQMGGVPAPNQILQSGGVTTGLKDISGTGSPAWPAGTQQTAGGYIILAMNEGRRGFDVCKPGSTGCTADNLLYKCEGDPHVYDKSGNMLFSFTKNSDFKLPDGTTLAVDTSSQTGQSFLSSINIVNGNSNVKMSFADNDAITVGPDQNNGIQTLADRYKSTNWSQDTYNLALDATGTPSFYDFVKGQNEGKVTGFTQDGAATYLPTVDHNQTNYAVAKQFQPQIGSAAYGNMLFGNSLEQVLEDPKYKMGAGDAAQMMSTWESDLAQTEDGNVGARMQQSPPFAGYSGSPYFGGVNPQSLNYVQGTYGAMSPYLAMQQSIGQYR